MEYVPSTYIYHKVPKKHHVAKYTSPMNPMGYLDPMRWTLWVIYFLCSPIPLMVQSCQSCRWRSSLQPFSPCLRRMDLHPFWLNKNSPSLKQKMQVCSEKWCLEFCIFSGAMLFYGGYLDFAADCLESCWGVLSFHLNHNLAEEFHWSYP